MCFVHGHTRPCQLTTNWDCTCFRAVILKDTWLEARKAIQSKDGAFSLFPGSLRLINSSEWAWTCIRSHKGQLFLNVEFFIHEQSFYQDIAISFPAYCCSTTYWLVTALAGLTASLGILHERLFLYSRYWTGTSLLHCMLVPVQHWEYENGLLLDLQLCQLYAGLAGARGNTQD